MNPYIVTNPPTIKTTNPNTLIPLIPSLPPLTLIPKCAAPPVNGVAVADALDVPFAFKVAVETAVENVLVIVPMVVVLVILVVILWIRPPGVECEEVREMNRPVSVCIDSGEIVGVGEEVELGREVWVWIV